MNDPMGRLRGIRARAGLRARALVTHSRFRISLSLVTGAVLGMASLSVLGAGTYEVGPLRVGVGLSFDLRGRTVIDVPPLGTIEARTHAIPLRVNAAADHIVIDEVRNFVDEAPEAQDMLAEIGKSAEQSRLEVTLRVLLAGAFGGLLGAAFLRGGLRRAAAALLSGALVPAALVAATVATYEPKAFAEPTLTGALSAAPQFLGPIGEIEERLETYREQLEVVGNTVFKVYRFLSDQSDLPKDAIKLMHISDLHLNPVGYDLALSAAGTFRVDAIIDSGDTVAEGDEIENSFLAPASAFKVPYFWVRGNHDSADTERAIKGLTNVTVLDNGTAAVHGVTIFGVGDPTFTPGRSKELDTEEQRRVKAEFARRVREMVDALPNPPDIVVVHDRTIASELAGEVPLVVSGHTHKFGIRKDQNTDFVTVGSTGGAGLISLSPDQGEPYALEILYISRTSRRLLALDRVQVLEKGARFSVSRITFERAEESGAKNEH